MAGTGKPLSYFSIPFDLLSCGSPLPCDLYINSSGLLGVQKFVRITPKGDCLSQGDIERFRQKYHRLYVAEEQRLDYLSGICAGSGATSVAKTQVIKESAIHHLESVFTATNPSTEVLTHAIQGGRDVVDNMVHVIMDYDIESLRNMIGQLSFHDFYTYDHSVNVSMYAILLFRALFPGAPREKVIEAGLAGLLHDLGKINIPSEILNKAGALSEEQMAVIKKHPRQGREYLGRATIRLSQGMDLESLGRAIHEHHENWDGSGYPRGIGGTEIHLLARITAVADFFDAVTTKRSYSEPLSTPDALVLMRRSAGKKLDPSIYNVFSAVALQAAAKGDSRESKLAGHELPADYDPCQPHEALPLREIEATSLAKAEKPADFGKIVILNSDGGKAADKAGGRADSSQQVSPRASKKTKRAS